MTDNDARGLEAAVAAAPDDVPLRLQLAEVLIALGRAGEALTHIGTVLQRDPHNAWALAAVGRAGAALSGAAPSEAAPSEAADTPGTAAAPGQVDWNRLEHEIRGDVPPPFVEPGERVEPADRPALAVGGPDDAEARQAAVEVNEDRVTLDDVGGLDDVKRRLHTSFLEPLKHPEIADAFGKDLRGGLMLYGPPGCGKTFVARAVAGELDARFVTATLVDVLDKYIGETEKNIHAIFESARIVTPAVLFLDELDSIAGRRSTMGGGGGVWMRSAVNQVLLELDSLNSHNDGLFVLGATNSPWDVDPAFLRPGRFDRTLLVLPPDPPARAAILRQQLQRRPIAGIDLDWIVRHTDGFSGADLTYLCSAAAELAMMDSIAARQVRPVTMDDVRRALEGIRPSTTAWLEAARNVVMFANPGGMYDDLREYLAAHKIL